jgi:SAM-dependent methyltransferase
VENNTLALRASEALRPTRETGSQSEYPVEIEAAPYPSQLIGNLDMERRHRMRKELELNRAHWDEATRLHTRSNVYGTEDFKAGSCQLHRVETEELGDVTGQRLLHLQCHFGLDTLSWARRGATVTGVDFSPVAIAAARELSLETSTPGEFICSDLYALPEHLDAAESFDLVFTSYGVLTWLPDLRRWGEVISHYLKPGGVFYMVEAHPTARMFPTDDDSPTIPRMRPFISYFHEPAGLRWPPGPDYADTAVTLALGEHSWQHSLADVVGALLGAGLVLDQLHEFPFCSWKVVAGCELVERFGATRGYYGLPASQPQLPLMFSVRAHRPR